MFNSLSHNNVKTYLSRSLFPYLSAINILFIFHNNPYPFYYETWSEFLTSSRRSRTRQILICFHGINNLTCISEFRVSTPTFHIEVINLWNINENCNLIVNILWVDHYIDLHKSARKVRLCMCCPGIGRRWPRYQFLSYEFVLFKNLLIYLHF